MCSYDYFQYFQLLTTPGHPLKAVTGGTGPSQGKAENALGPIE